MSMVQKTVEVDVPLHTAYNQWTQFEDFPQFMDGVEQVVQIDERHNHWRTKIAGVSREFDTEIVDQLPDQKIAWRTVGGDVQQMGVVSFARLDDARCEVRLAMDYDPQGMAEHAADTMGMIDRRVSGDLDRFKSFVEERGLESGGWRGRITPA
ncbi:SRPBCC family protein [Kitasatospora sp. YST-16]|uniref:SRPBCC family protein n=1 Tax=unclassified Kitasatospora TaxID=2633591 RepID=UPI0004C32567|nr:MULTISPECIES: SRPBCC family protein [unclassified Kitasatospora]WAL70124.1 SRPBCC family protein [Kitasatospora sp. YST-16]WNW36164.1 SRPBCC family protein [Streptomyces sp. Li-HN-5-13]